MEKNNQNTFGLNNNSTTIHKASSDITKTTNINILLNRVKLDKKKDFNKKITFLCALVLCIVLTSFFALV